MMRKGNGKREKEVKRELMDMVITFLCSHIKTHKHNTKSTLVQLNRYSMHTIGQAIIDNGAWDMGWGRDGQCLL